MRDSQRPSTSSCSPSVTKRLSSRSRGSGMRRRRYFFEGVMEEELLISAEEITGSALPPLQLRKDRLKRGDPPRIVVLKCHLPFLRLR